MSRLGITIYLFTVSLAVLPSSIVVASEKIVFSLVYHRLLLLFFSFKLLSSAKTPCSICGFASLFFEKWVGTSYSKIKSKDGDGRRNVEDVSGNPSTLLLLSLLLLGILFAVLIC